MGDFGRHLRHDWQRVDEDVRTLAADAEALLRHAADDLGEGRSQAQEKLRASIETARRTLERAGDTARQATARQGREAVHYVREHPWQAAAIGIVAGIALAWLLRRAGRD